MIKLALIAVAIFLTACGSQQPRSESPGSEKRAKPAKITLFYPSENPVPRGEKVVICYGVEDAASVSIDPPVEQLKPSFNRCFEHIPREAGKYTLKATGKDGAVVEQSFELKIGPRAPAQESAGGAKGGNGPIRFFSAAKQQVRRGEQVMLCYEIAASAGEVSLTPSPGAPLARPKGCVQVSPQADTTYKLSVPGASEQVRIRVSN